LEEQKRSTPESDIELLALISQPLRVELHYEIYSRTLTAHPLFRRIDEDQPPAEALPPKAAAGHSLDSSRIQEGDERVVLQEEAHHRRTRGRTVESQAEVLFVQRSD